MYSPDLVSTLQHDTNRATTLLSLNLLMNIEFPHRDCANYTAHWSEFRPSVGVLTTRAYLTDRGLLEVYKAEAFLAAKLLLRSTGTDGIRTHVSSYRKASFCTRPGTDPNPLKGVEANRIRMVEVQQQSLQQCSLSVLLVKKHPV